MFKRIIIGLILLAGYQIVNAQAKDSVSSSAYELISGYYNDNFHPFDKSNIYVGFALTLRDQQLDNTQRLFDRVSSGSELDYGLTFKAGYFIGPYVMTEMDIIYRRNTFDGRLINQNGDSLSRNSINSSVLLIPNLKLFFPLSKNERLSFFNAIGMGFGFGQTLTRDEFSPDEISKAFTDEFSFTIGISPGITFFAIENFAFEVQLNNLIGYEYKRSETTRDGSEQSSRVTNNVNFNINLLSLQLGLAYFIGAKR